MENHFQNDQAQVKTKIDDEDLPVVNHQQTKVHKSTHQYEQDQKMLLTLRLMSKVIPRGPHSLHQFWLNKSQKTIVQPDMQFQRDLKASHH